MAPREGTPLLVNSSNVGSNKHFDISNNNNNNSSHQRQHKHKCWIVVGSILLLFVGIITSCMIWIHLEEHSGSGGRTKTTTTTTTTTVVTKKTGPYQLVECQEGDAFVDAYDFYDGVDSLGSAGYNVYVSKDRASQRGILRIVDNNNDNDHHQREQYVYMSSAPSNNTNGTGPRESIRLEGKRRYDDGGLFVLDVRHMPAGPGVWPAFWLTDEDDWPSHGEIDILEGINNQTRAKTALHTSSMCSMYAQVANYDKTGYWDRATGIPDTFTGERNYETNKEADDCWNLAAHQWFNQGCVGINDEDGTIGAPLNDNGGGVFALEWDPTAGYIKSWAFPRHFIPANVQQAMDGANVGTTERTTTTTTTPDPRTWGLPYAYFAIGESSSCSADHFQNMHIVFNLAFCGNVAGNRFFKDCEEEAQQYNVSNDPVMSCNAYIDTNPQVLDDEAYWKIRGVYVYERTMEEGIVNDNNETKHDDDDDVSAATNSSTGTD